MAINLACALIATLAATLPRAARDAAALDVSRLLAISRNPELDTVLQQYSDWKVSMKEEVLNTRVGYGWVEGLNRRALVIGSQQPEKIKDVENQSDDETGNHVTDSSVEDIRS